MESYTMEHSGRCRDWRVHWVHIRGREENKNRLYIATKEGRWGGFLRGFELVLVTNIESVGLGIIVCESARYRTTKHRTLKPRQQQSKLTTEIGLSGGIGRRLFQCYGYDAFL